jgi:hypothetical protein
MLIVAVLCPNQDWRVKVVECLFRYYSRNLHDVEMQFQIDNRELLAIHKGLAYWVYYLK